MTSKTEPPDSQQQSHVLYNGPSFHVSGVQIVPDAGDLSLYLTATRHAFSPNGTQIRSVNEIVARLIMSPSGIERLSDALRKYLEQQKAAA